MTILIELLIIVLLTIIVLYIVKEVRSKMLGEIKVIDVEYDKDNPYVLKKAHNSDACYDICVPNNTEVKKGRQIVYAGFKIALPYGYAAIICPRSGHSSKGLPVTIYTADVVDDTRINADVLHGIVDSGYRGKVGVILNVEQWFPSTSRVYITAGTKIAQMKIIKLPEVELHSVESINDNTDRGTTGYGDSGK